jgi:hypothetical protein
LFLVFLGGIKPMIPLVHGSCSFARIALANIQAGAHWISVGMKKSVTIQLKSVLRRSIAWMLLNFVE